MSDLPASWATASVAEVADVIAGQAPPGTSYNKNGEGLPLYQGKTDFGDVHLGPPRLWTTKSTKHASSDDVLLSVRAPVGPTNLAREECAIGRGLAAIKGYRGISQAYLLYAIRATARQLEQQATGTTFSAISSSVVRGHVLPIAPAVEQERIVAAIEEQFSRLDAGIAALGRIRRNIKRMRGAVLQAAVTGMLFAEDGASVGEGEVGDDLLADHLNATNARKVQRAADDLMSLTWAIPPSWAWKSASEVCEVVASGSTPPKAAMTAGRGDVPYIKVYNLTHSGDLDFSVRPTFIDRDTHEGSLRRSRLYPGDVLTNIVGPPLGKVSVVPNEYPEWNTNQAVVVFRPVPSIHPRLLRYWLLSPPVLKLLESTSRATAGQFNVSLTTCRALPLPIPPRTQQDALVAIIEDGFSLLDAVEAAAERALSRSSSLRASVLAAAFSGKLVSQDPNDESASMLLERIMAERASSNGYKPTKARQIRRKIVA